jgi:transcriptional regulator with XRE-family HTH domain
LGESLPYAHIVPRFASIVKFNDSVNLNDSNVILVDIPAEARYTLPAGSLVAEEIYAHIGSAIRARRDSLGLSQAQLADRVGLGRTSITMIERGAQALLLHQFLQLAAALRCSPSELLGEAMHQPELDLDEPADAPDIEHLLKELKVRVQKITRT